MADSETTRIRVIKSAHTPFIRLSVNGEEYKVPAEGEHNIPNRFLGALRDSNVEFETVVGAAEGEAGAVGGIESDASPASLARNVVDHEFIVPEDVKTKEELDQADPSKDANEKAEEKNDDNSDDALLDHSVAEIVPQLEGMDTAHLKRLLKAEKGGKTRSTLISAIEDEIANPERAKKDAETK